MLDKLFSGKLFDKEAATYETVQAALTDVAAELNLPFKDIFITIMPTNAAFDHKYYVCKYDDKGNPVKVREITLKEILGEKE